MYGEVDDDVDIGYVWWEWVDVGDCDGENVFVCDGLFYCCDGGIEVFDMVDYECYVCFLGSGDDFVVFCDG